MGFIVNGEIDLSRVDQYVESGLVRSVRHPQLPLVILCYTHLAQYMRAWDDVTKECRGLVVDLDGRVVSRGLPKFGNYGDPLFGTAPDAPFVAHEKYDGSLIHVSSYEGELLVHTKGSFTVNHVQAAIPFLAGWAPNEGATALFEGIFGFNRVVVDYGDFRGLVLLGEVEHVSGLDWRDPSFIAEETGWFGEIARPAAFSLESMVRTMQDPESGDNREGFVLTWPNEGGPAHRLKIKFSRYVRLHSLMSNVTERRIHDAMLEGTFEEFLSSCPDEIYSDVERVFQRFTSEALEICNQARSFVSCHRESRKDAADDHRNAPGALQGIVWSLYDGQQERAFKSALRMVKSEPISIVEREEVE